MAPKKREPAGIPAWMVTFGDMMSLLLCFFIMLFALSIITPVRFQALVDTLQQDFTGYAGTARERVRANKTTTTVTDSDARSRRISALAGGQPIPGPPGEQTDVYTILLDGETIRGGLIRFELGSSELTDQARWDLRATLPILRGSPQKIEVRGYVAPGEGGGIYQRDSDLAFYRALGVVDYLVSHDLARDFFEIVVAPGTLPNLNILPAGTDPRHAGASVEIRLLNQTLRTFQE
jgi:chemotaxis protein MotB